MKQIRKRRKGQIVGLRKAAAGLLILALIAAACTDPSNDIPPEAIIPDWELADAASAQVLLHPFVCLNPNEHEGIGDDFGQIDGPIPVEWPPGHVDGWYGPAYRPAKLLGPTIKPEVPATYFRPDSVIVGDVPNLYLEQLEDVEGVVDVRLDIGIPEVDGEIYDLWDGIITLGPESTFTQQGEEFTGAGRLERVGGDLRLTIANQQFDVDADDSLTIADGAFVELIPQPPTVVEDSNLTRTDVVTSLDLIRDLEQFGDLSTLGDPFYETIGGEFTPMRSSGLETALTAVDGSDIEFRIGNQIAFEDQVEGLGTLRTAELIITDSAAILQEYVPAEPVDIGLEPFDVEVLNGASIRFENGLRLDQVSFDDVVGPDISQPEFSVDRDQLIDRLDSSLTVWTPDAIDLDLEDPAEIAMTYAGLQMEPVYMLWPATGGHMYGPEGRPVKAVGSASVPPPVEDEGYDKIIAVLDTSFEMDPIEPEPGDEFTTLTAEQRLGGHGSFINGIIKQALPNAKIVSVDLGLTAQNTDDVLEDGLDTLDAIIAAEGLKTEDLEAINMSFGTYSCDNRPPQRLRRAIDKLLDNGNGPVVFAAAGNDHVSHPWWPAAFAPGRPNLYSVGSVTTNGCSSDINGMCRSWFSNYGPWVEICEVGDQLRINPWVDNDGDGLDDANDEFIWSGTSFAAPRALANYLSDSPKSTASTNTACKSPNIVATKP